MGDQREVWRSKLVVKKIGEVAIEHLVQISLCADNAEVKSICEEAIGEIRALIGKEG